MSCGPCFCQLPLKVLGYGVGCASRRHSRIRSGSACFKSKLTLAVLSMPSAKRFSICLFRDLGGRICL